MAALFDLHTLIALQNGWLRFSGATSTVEKGKTNFRNCFPMVEDPVVDSWFSDLQDVRFRAFGSPGIDGFPLVAVKLEQETTRSEFLGDALFAYREGTPAIDRGRTVKGAVVGQEIDVYVATTSHELTRALYTCVRSLMFRLLPTFKSAGYVSVEFLSGGELMPDEQLISEDAGVFVRHMRWRALATIAAFPLEDGTAVDGTGKPWYVHVDDLAGGKVKPT